MIEYYIIWQKESNNLKAEDCALSNGLTISITTDQRDKAIPCNLRYLWFQKAWDTEN